MIRQSRGCVTHAVACVGTGKAKTFSQMSEIDRGVGRKNRFPVRGLSPRNGYATHLVDIINTLFFNTLHYLDISNTLFFTQSVTLGSYIIK